VGRSPAPKCSLTLDVPYVSGVHAALRWSGDGWELKDLGSRNGTYVGGRRLDAGTVQRIARGSRIAFGRAEQEWTMIDDSAPESMIVPLDGGDPLVVGDMVALPSSQDPRATLYRAIDGSWILEEVDEPPRSIAHLQTFESAGRLWRFSHASTSRATLAASGDRAGLDFRVARLSLLFQVSRDEEHVHIQASFEGRQLDLGVRRHHYLLLTLARRRLADIAERLPDSACGWIDQDELAHDPSMASPQLNGDVFRIRQQFAKLGVADAAAIIERRPRPWQLRIGTQRVSIVTE
jgi:hypothetical protein